MQSLQSVIVVRSEDRDTSAELHALARLMLVEYEAGAAGRQGLLDRLAEVMFVMVLRHHMQRAPELKGFLAALKDERVARALAALHRAPGEPWRVETLAREAGMSRTVFAERFAALLGRTQVRRTQGIGRYRLLRGHSGFLVVFKSRRLPAKRGLSRQRCAPA